MSYDNYRPTGYRFLPEVVKNLLPELPSLHFLRHPVNLGQGAALQTGIQFALGHGARYLVTFDADGQHTPESIPALLEPLQSGQVDAVLGSKTVNIGVVVKTACSHAAVS